MPWLGWHRAAGPERGHQILDLAPQHIVLTIPASTCGDVRRDAAFCKLVLIFVLDEFDTSRAGIPIKPCCAGIAFEPFRVPTEIAVRSLPDHRLTPDPPLRSFSHAMAGLPSESWIAKGTTKTEHQRIHDYHQSL
jgi:hypothetical protein